MNDIIPIKSLLNCKIFNFYTMKYFMVLWISLFVISCEKQKESSATIADNFVKQFIVSDSYDLKDVNTYMTPEYIRHYNLLPEKDKKIHEEYIKAMMDRFREEVGENNNAYALEKIENRYIEEFQKEILYEGNGDIFLLKSNDKTTIFIIVENNKIYSFCVDLYLSPKGKILPYFFFKEFNAQRIEADLTFKSIALSSLYGTTDEKYNSFLHKIDSTLENSNEENEDLKLCRYFKKLQKHAILRAPYIFLNIEKDSVITVLLSEQAYEKVKDFKQVDLYKEKKKVVVQLDFIEKEKGIFYAEQILDVKKVDGRSRSNIRH